MRKERPTNYQRNLPHWRAEGALYFVTFRTADSIPRHVYAEWLQDRELAHRDSDLTPVDIDAFNLHQARKLFSSLDKCSGECLLKNRIFAKVVADALIFHHLIKLRCGDFIIMPNHVHWIVAPLDGYTLEETLHSVKRWTAREINKLLGRSGSFWQKESFDRIIRDQGELGRTRDYIEKNGEKARLEKEEFLYHRAEWL